MKPLVPLYLDLRRAQMVAAQLNSGVAVLNSEAERADSALWFIESAIEDLGIKPVDAYMWKREQVMANNRPVRNHWATDMHMFCQAYGWDWNELEAQYKLSQGG